VDLRAVAVSMAVGGSMGDVDLRDAPASVDAQASAVTKQAAVQSDVAQ